MALDEVLHWAEQLASDQQSLLIFRLRVKQAEARKQETMSKLDTLGGYDQNRQLRLDTQPPEHDSNLTRDELLREVEILRQTPVRAGEGLLGKYTDTSIPEVSEEEIHAQLHAIATEWEHELDEFS